MRTYFDGSLCRKDTAAPGIQIPGAALLCGAYGTSKVLRPVSKIGRQIYTELGYFRGCFCCPGRHFACPGRMNRPRAKVLPQSKHLIRRAGGDRWNDPFTPCLGGTAYEKTILLTQLILLSWIFIFFCDSPDPPCPHFPPRRCSNNRLISSVCRRVRNSWYWVIQPYSTTMKTV